MSKIQLDGGLILDCDDVEAIAAKRSIEYSIAVSLKRIADAMEKQAQHKHAWKLLGQDAIECVICGEIESCK